MGGGRGKCSFMSYLLFAHEQHEQLHLLTEITAFIHTPDTQTYMRISDYYETNKFLIYDPSPLGDSLAFHMWVVPLSYTDKQNELPLLQIQ